MFAVITVIHILACVFLILVVLLQTGKGAEMGAVFGGSSSTVFGSTGAGNFLTRLTTATAVIFMLTSLSLTYFSARQSTVTILDSAPVSDALPASDEPPLAAPVGEEAPPIEQAAPSQPDPAPAPIEQAAPAQADPAPAPVEQAAPAQAEPAPAP